MLKLNLKMLKLKKPRKSLRGLAWIDALKKKLPSVMKGCEKSI